MQYNDGMTKLIDKHLEQVEEQYFIYGARRKIIHINYLFD